MNGLVIRKSVYLEIMARLGKSVRDRSKLIPKIIIDKNGHPRKVYVKLGLPVKPAEGGKVENKQEISTILNETSTEHKLDNFELKRKCYDYARQAFQGEKFLNKDTGRVIIVSKDGLGEWKSKSKSREQILSIKILDKMLENALYTHDVLDKQERRNIENISYFTSKCKINGAEYSAIITVRKIKNYGDKYYHHYLEDIKIEPRSGLTRPAGETG